MTQTLRPFPRRRASRQDTRLQNRLTLESLECRSLLSASGFVETSLASDLQGVAAHTDPDLVNPWGMTESNSGLFWIAANGAGNSPLMTPGGIEVGKPIVIPPPAGSPPDTTAAPTGMVANITGDFVIKEGHRSAPASLIYATEDGTIAAWNPAVDVHNAVLAADESSTGAVYKGLATGKALGHDYLYATDFHNGQITVFDKNFHVVQLAGSFTDPNEPPPPIGSPGFAPFGISNIGGKLYVTYALQDEDQHDDVAGAGNGFVDVFDTSGHFLKRLDSGTAVGGTISQLNSPWGMAVAPPGYGPGGSFSNALLVGNFGDSHVSAFNITTGNFLGQLSDTGGTPLTLNGGVGGVDTKGLWGIEFGNGHAGASPNALFFSAGINDEGDGLFGKVTMTISHSGPGTTATPMFAMPSTSGTTHATFSTNLGASQVTVSSTTHASITSSTSQHPLMSFASATSATAKVKAIDAVMAAHARGWIR